MIAPAFATALRQPGFTPYLSSHVISTAGTWAQRVVLYWLAWEASRNPAVLGYLAATDLLPAVLAAPFAGSLADRFDRRKLVLWLQLLSTLPALAGAAAIAAGWVSVPVLIALSLATGILNGFDHPLRMVVVGGLVERHALTSAVTLNAMGFNIGRMVGPALGGLAIASGAPALVFLANAASYLLFAAVLLRLRQQREAGSRPAGSKAGSWKGVYGVLTPQQRFALLSFATVALFVRPVFELLPAFANALTPDLAEAGTLFAWLTSASALGAVAGSAVFGQAATRVALPRAVLITATGVVACMALFLLAPGQWTALLAITVLSGGVITNGIACQVMLQTGAPDHVRGKVLSLYTMIFRGLPAVGALIIGSAAGVVSPTLPFWIGIVLLALCCALIWRRLW